MANKVKHDDYDEFSSSSSSDEDITPSIEQTIPNTMNQNSIKHYVSSLLHQFAGGDDDQQQQQPTDLSQTEIRIERKANSPKNYENLSAFRQYHSNDQRPVRINAQRQTTQDDTETITTATDDERFQERSSTDVDDSFGELNLDPNPIIEQRESAEQIYKQKVYLRQLQPPTPQPVEVQVQEVLLPSQGPKPPIHVRVGQREPRTPSPIVIKSTPPKPPPQNSDQPIIYNKYVPPPKQPPQQIIIHRYPDLPPKPRPIVVEQWLPYKPAPKRIIKHSLPPEALKTPPPPHNLLVSYAKPRALIEVELVRLPIVKIDPQTYQLMSAQGPQQLAQHPSFQHEQTLLTTHQPNIPTNPIDWRI